MTANTHYQLQSDNNISNVLDVHGGKSDCVMNVDASAIIVYPTMEVHTGSAVSMIPEYVYQSHFSKCELQPSNKVIRSFTGESVPCKDRFNVHVQYKTDSVDL